METEPKVTSVSEGVAPLLHFDSALQFVRRKFNDFSPAPIQVRTRTTSGEGKQLRRKLTRERAHYAATATCYLCRGCKRPASPLGTELCDWTKRELEAGLNVSTMPAIGHTPTSVIYCLEPLYDMLKLVNSCLAHQNCDEICRRDPERDLQDIIREVYK